MNFEKFLPEKKPEVNRETQSFIDKTKDIGFLSSLRSSDLAKIARNLSMAVMFIGPMATAQTSESEAEPNRQEQIQLAQKTESKILASIQLPEKGGFVGKDFDRYVLKNGVEKVTQRGFVRTDGKCMQIGETGRWNMGLEGEYRGTSYYWADKDMDGQPEAMINIRDVEPNPEVDSIAFSCLEKDIQSLTGEDIKKLGSLEGKIYFSLREGEKWKIGKVGDPEVREEYKEEDLLYRQERFSDLLEYTARGLEEGHIRE